jgi:thioredoxin-related protein
MLAVWILSVASIFASSPSEGPFQDLTVDQALTAAQRDKKVVMIDFFTTWCGPCKKLDKTTWTNPEVQKWLAENTVALRLDAEKEVDLAKKHRIDAYPTMLFLKSDGTLIDRIVGYRTPEEFLSDAKDALAGKNAVSRAKEKLVGHENDPMAHERYADALAQSKRYEDALAEYLWCFDHGKVAPGYAGVRLSFLLSDLTQLGGRFPPAIQALEDRRDAAESRLSAGSNSFDDLRDAVALNRNLGAVDRNLALFDKMRAAKPLSSEMRLAFGAEILEPLVAARRYQDALDLFDDPEGFVTWHIKMSRSLPKSGDDKDEEMKKAMEGAEQYMREEMVTKCAKMYEALAGASKKELAAKVAEDLIEFAPSGHTYSTLIASAVRAQANDVAKSLADRGLTALPEKERKEVERAAKSIPAPK